MNFFKIKIKIHWVDQNRAIKETQPNPNMTCPKVDTTKMIQPKLF